MKRNRDDGQAVTYFKTTCPVGHDQVKGKGETHKIKEVSGRPVA
jgi:hypothetical protein